MQVRPHWRAQDVKFSQITCAMSNKVYCVSSGAEKVLLRIYGSADHGLFVRSEEVKQTSLLASFGFGPQVLRTFDLGRIESWVQGGTPSNEAMRTPTAVGAIAKKLRALHEKTGLNHNDLHRNNMLFAEDGSVEFLDFEYSGPADPAYDIANHFNEWMYPYTGPDPHLFQLGLYPSLFQRRDFASHYLGNTAGKGTIVDDFLVEVERRRKDSHAFWIDWAVRTGPSDFNGLYAQARRTLLQGDHVHGQVLGTETGPRKTLQNVARTVAGLYTLRPLSALLQAPNALEAMALQRASLC